MPPWRCLRTRKDLIAAVSDPLTVTPTDLQDMLVSDVLAANPAAARIFIDRGMGCIGCVFASFETVAEVACAYGFEPSELAHSLATHMASTLEGQPQ